MKIDPLTPVQIALLAMAHEAFERGPSESVAVWGSWERAARALAEQSLLSWLGTARGTRAMEYTTLHGRHRRGKKGRLVHLYRLAGHQQLAARCAWAVAHKPAGRSHVTWKDVPAEVPRSAWPDGRRCSACGCTPGKPCAVDLPGGCGEASCVPAGTYGLDRCSACQLRRAA